MSPANDITGHMGASVGESGPKTTELEQANAALNQVNALLMRQMVKKFSEGRKPHGLYGSADNRDLGVIDELLGISAAINDHIEKEGGLNGLNVELGVFIYPQQFLDSMTGIFIAPTVTEEDLLNVNKSSWPSRVEGLAIAIGRAACFDNYYLVEGSEKQFNWFEAARNA